MKNKLDMEIQKIKLRYILNSAGKKSIESDVVFQNGYSGTASSPSAIKPGKREKEEQGKKQFENVQELESFLNDGILRYGISDQKSMDEYLLSIREDVGTAVTLAVSIAFARACANSMHRPLFEHIRLMSNNNKEFKLPLFLIPVFSGGVHGIGRNDSFQQIMIVVQCECMQDLVEYLQIFNRTIQVKIEELGVSIKEAASGGKVVESLKTNELLPIVNSIADMILEEKYRGIAIDVAAEHLYYSNSYHIDGNHYSAEQLFSFLSALCNEYPIVYLEDPFIPEDVDYWKRFKIDHDSHIDIIGDDFFATQTKYISHLFANGAVIKLNQVGTLTSCLEAVAKLLGEQMCTCVSHRSCETEDTVISDLSIAISSKYVKIGNINREERIIKYNRFIRIEDFFRQNY